MIQPSLTGLVQQRQGGEAAQPLVRIVWRARLQPGDPQTRGFPLNRVRVRRRHQHAVPETEGQKIAQCQRATRRLGLIERPVEAFQDAPVGQLRQYAIERLIQPQSALFHQNHGRDGRDRLGHGGDAKQRIACDRLAAFQIPIANRLDARFAAPVEQRHDAGDFAPLDVRRKYLAHALEPCLRVPRVRSHCRTPS